VREEKKTSKKILKTSFSFEGSDSAFEIQLSRAAK
jgi:hypothetical protein